jgi:uncharacterized damage-inducible protein DinB
MQETPQQYTARILGFAEGRDALQVLSSTAGRLRTLVDSTPPAKWTVKPAPNRWSAREILAHLADVEIVIGWRFRAMLAVDGVTIQAYDQDLWADAFKYAEVDRSEALATFSAGRASLISLLKRVDHSRYAHAGMHEERGRESVPHLMRMMAGHDLNHLGQIERLVL